MRQKLRQDDEDISRSASSFSLSSEGDEFSNFPTVSDLELSLKIKELVKAKVEAAEIEDYKLATALKKSVDDLNKALVEVGKLEQNKRAAVLRDEFDTAASMKAQIDVLKIEVLKSIPQYPGSHHFCKKAKPFQKEKTTHCWTKCWHFQTGIRVQDEGKGIPTWQRSNKQTSQSLEYSL